MFIKQKIAIMDNKEQRKIVRAMIVDIVRKMLSRELSIKWIGKKIDLFEMIHTAYMTMEILHEDGTPYMQSEMIRSIFSWQQMSVGNNMYIYNNRLNSRKGILARSIIDRMQHLLFVSNVKAEPLLLLQKLQLAESVCD